MFVRNMPSEKIKKCFATSHLSFTSYNITLTYSKPRVNFWDKVIKNGPSEVYGRQPLKNSK